MDTQIIEVVSKLQKTHRRIYPWMVQGWVDFDRDVSTFRRHMARLAEEGRLVRVGGDGSRRGYLAA